MRAPTLELGRDTWKSFRAKWLAHQEAQPLHRAALGRINVNALSDKELITLLSSESICPVGARGILEWRWQRFLAGEPVRYKEHYYPIEAYFVPPADAAAFPVKSAYEAHSLWERVPLDVWRQKIVPHLDALPDVWSLMMTCKQFYGTMRDVLLERAHDLIVVQNYHATHRHGCVSLKAVSYLMRGVERDLGVESEMAQRFSAPYWFRVASGSQKVALCLATYGSMEAFLGFRAFKKTQKSVILLDEQVHHAIVQENLRHINAEVETMCAFPLFQVTHDNRRKRDTCRFVNERIPLIVAQFDLAFWDPSLFLVRCTNLMRKKTLTPNDWRPLRRHLPPPYVQFIISYFCTPAWTDVVYGMFDACAVNRVRHLVYCLNHLYIERGEQWFVDNYILQLIDWTCASWMAPSDCNQYCFITRTECILTPYMIDFVVPFEVHTAWSNLACKFLVYVSKE